MPRRNTYTRRRRTYNEPRRRRSVMMRPGVQIGILLVAALIIFILLQSGAR